MRATANERGTWETGFRRPDEGWHIGKFLEGIDYLKTKDKSSGEEVISANKQGDKNWKFPMVIEDEDVVRSFAARALKRQGYEVLEASTGVEALEVMDKNAGRIDIVVSDVIMPEMDGQTLLKELRKTNPTLKIIFVSGYPNDAFKASLFPGPVSLDLVAIPLFTPSEVPRGDRLSFFDPFARSLAAPGQRLAIREPATTLGNTQLAARLYRTFGSYEAALYVFRGFFPEPAGTMASDTPPNASARPTSFTVPSPPQAKTSEAPRAVASRASSKAWPARSVTRTSASTPSAASTARANSARRGPASGRPRAPEMGLTMTAARARSAPTPTPRVKHETRGEPA